MEEAALEEVEAEDLAVAEDTTAVMAAEAGKTPWQTLCSYTKSKCCIIFVRPQTQASDFTR